MALIRLFRAACACLLHPPYGPFLLCRYTDHVYLKGANPLGDGALYLWSQKLSLNTPVARFSGEQKVEFKIIGGESCRVAGLQGRRVAGL